MLNWLIKHKRIPNLSSVIGTLGYVLVGQVIADTGSTLKHNSIACVQQSVATAYGAP